MATVAGQIASKKAAQNRGNLMNLVPQFNDKMRYLETSDIVDFMSPEVTNLSYVIRANSVDEIDFIKNAFEYVRDKISHSADITGKKVTCSASEVLAAKEGICYAKSHLLAAILRRNLIPTGFCYQRLILNDETAPYLVLHGLNAVYIEKIGKWIRIDARGNKPGVDARFSLEREYLAFPVRVEMGEENIPTIFAEPDKNVVQALTCNKNFDALWAGLPSDLYSEVPPWRHK